MIKRIWLGLILVSGLSLQAAGYVRTPANSPELYAKILRLWSLNTGLPQNMIVGFFPDKIIEDLNDDMILRTIDRRLANLELELFMQYTENDPTFAGK